MQHIITSNEILGARANLTLQNRATAAILNGAILKIRTHLTH